MVRGTMSGRPSEHRTAILRSAGGCLDWPVSVVRTAGGVPLVQIYCVRSLLQSVHRAETFVCTEDCAAPAAGTTGLHSPFAPLQDGGAVITRSAAHGPHHDQPPARHDTAQGRLVSPISRLDALAATGRDRVVSCGAAAPGTAARHPASCVWTTRFTALWVAPQSVGHVP